LVATGAEPCSAPANLSPCGTARIGAGVLQIAVDLAAAHRLTSSTNAEQEAK
jgi:hypothetical protein